MSEPANRWYCMAVTDDGTTCNATGLGGVDGFDLHYRTHHYRTGGLLRDGEE